MITRIELVNFMSHAHTVLEPAPGLTVLVGPNNCGKSAVVGALQILATNENSTFVQRHGTDECSVAVTTDDGHHVMWSRKNSPKYTIDGAVFDRLKVAGVPTSQLQAALRLPLVAAHDAANEKFDLHFGDQKKPMFLIDQTAGRAAQFFASATDASGLLAMQKAHKARTAAATAERAALQKRLDELSKTLTALAGVDALDHRVQAVEAASESIEARCRELARGEALVDDLRSNANSLALDERRATALRPLRDPPQLEDVAGLARLVSELQTAARELARADRQAGVLARLPQPLAFDDPQPIELAIDALTQALASARTLAHDAERATQSVESFHAREVAAFIATHPTCPLCHSALDASCLLGTHVDQRPKDTRE